VLPLLLKVTLAPALVATATLVGRRIGHGAAGLVSGLPVVAAPILVVFTVEEGTRFAAAAANGAVLGIASLVAFCVAYALVGRRAGALVALIAGWSAFAVGTAILSAVDVPLAVGSLITAIAICGGLAVLRGAAPAPAGREERRGDLLVWRLVVTVAMVLALTAAARGLSPHVAGLLTPFPIITAVMAVFTQGRSGASAASAMLAGLVLALFSFLAFFALLGSLLGHADPLIAYGSATTATLALWAALAWAARGGLAQPRAHAGLHGEPTAPASAHMREAPADRVAV
jgi:uncharacterized membrane protein (GlpM family)